MLVPVSDLAFHQQLAQLLVHLDAPKFWPRLAQFLGEVLHFDNWVAMLCRPNRPPLILGEFNANQRAGNLFADYQRDVYLLDPFFQFICGNPSGGLYRLDEVAPENFRKTEYFYHYFRINIVEDEVQYIAPVPGIGTVSLSLGKSSRFNAQNIGVLTLYKDWIIELMRHHCQRTTVIIDDSVTPTEDPTSRFKHALAEHSLVPLTKREMEIALLMLSGHSNKGIANRLEISFDTVKVHRRNMYTKLGITTQAALFMLLMKE